MSLREDNEKRDSQLRKEADLFRTGYLAGLDAAIKAIRGEQISTGLHEYHDEILQKAIAAIQALKEGKV